ncbi:TonB-dependent receptor [Novosphingobium sp. G106]|uniref:TonB-dependent receptor n=1 Tax=Novosphingobium sp. G106 TaxID=2849500 RepID=UPI001C2D1AC1|nr:TonB-dependent receptor [Novosphingobium sp. G106]MBV1687364.1 TonB-dependent receptor [Novosphingobium sp. G106]
MRRFHSETMSHANTSRRRAAVIKALYATPLVSIAWSAPVLAQEAAPSNPPPAQENRAYVDNGDIIVTARKRQESILKVPVVVSVVSNEKIESTGLTNVTELPKLVPGLVIAGNLLSIGPQVTIRGVGTSSFDPGVDQSVSLNIDGLSLGQGLAFGAAMFDVGQVEVLKGPQALFYGKGSPGGVISLRTADPTDQVELIARGSYEFVAREYRGELIASGPVTDTLGVRLAALYSEGDGYFINDAVPIPGTGGLAPTHSRNPQPRNFVLRGTFLFKPTDDFSARLKVNHSYDHQENAELKQLSNCLEPGQSFTLGSGLVPGIPPAPNFLTPIDPIRMIGNDNCKFDRHAPQVYLDPAAFPGVPNGGTPYLQNMQNFGTLELNYDVRPDLSLTSTTAYYDLKSSSLVNPTLSVASAPFFAVTNRFRRREFTEELRLNSDFSGPLNFTLGAFYEDGLLKDRVHFIRNTKYGFLSPQIFGASLGLPYFDLLNDDRESTINIKTYSAFGQLRYKITDQLELAGGVRYADERRDLSVIDYHANVTNTPGVPEVRDLTPTLPVTDNHSKTWSPEATITYTPNDDLTIFASYKKGYKSGSFSVAVPATAGQDKHFGDEKVRGFEVGLKSRLLDRSLLANLAFYDYIYDGLQVGVIEGFVNGSPVINTRNSGEAKTYGVDFDVRYMPRAVEGLTLTASVNWNSAHYKVLDTLGCYPNQTISQGCNTTPVATLLNGVPTTRFLTQNLNGAQMIRAPEWAANFGFDYEVPVGSGMKLQFSNNNQYSSKYPSYLALNRPNQDNFQGAYIKFDASITLKAANDRWEIALLGKNLSDKLTASNCSASSVAGGGVLGGDASGFATQQGTAGWAEALCFPDGPGRSIALRFTFRPFAGN